MQDYPNCSAPSPSYIGDGRCDNYGAYNTVECNFDGGDCEEFNAKYPNCNAYYPSLIGDGNCFGGDYNTAECGFDEGDCVDFNNKYPNCNAYNPYWIGDGNCDGDYYNTIECGFDGGDCTSGTSTTENSFPVWSVIGGLFLFIAIGIVIWKRKKNTTSTMQETAGGGGGVQSGNARIQGNNQSIADNGAPSPSAPTQNETREQKQHNRRFKILTSILQKKVVENPLKDILALPHETLQSDRSLVTDDDEEAQDGPLKEDIYVHVDNLASWRSSRRLVTDMVDQSETLYSPKTCAICLEIYKVNDTVCWSANEACHHAYHFDCMMDWLMENDECPLCRANYLEANQ
eukprot:scaffold1952_cov146-Chaetoceros_neogracile.AAC.1